MAHAHRHGGGPAAPQAHRRLLAVVAGALAAATVVGIVALWPSGDVRAGTGITFGSRLYSATVTDATTFGCTDSPTGAVGTCARYRFALTQGPDRGERRSIRFSDAPSTPRLAIGDRVILARVPGAEPGFDYAYSDRQRRSVLWWLAALFAIVVVAVGRLRGMAALVGLAASMTLILGFMVPSMLDGNNAPAVAIVSATAIAFVVLYVTNGFRTLTTVALLATLVALALTVVLATVFTELAHITGVTSEDALLLQLGTTNVDLKGLVLAGMVVGALGVLDDITVTQVAAIDELRRSSPGADSRTLYRSGMRVGRDHVASTVNTLALAYAGAALPLLILFTLADQSLGTVANSEAVAVEIVATLVGSIGLVAAVPVSTGLATWMSPPGPDPSAGVVVSPANLDSANLDSADPIRRLPE
ncbi:MAG: YibE/F family protein [Actinomycetota bacterium]